MLKISRLADYSTVIMGFLASCPSQSFSAASIAEQTPIALPTVSKLLKLLSEAGLLQSTRGVNGGYQLSRDANAISLAEIITAIDGAPAMTECSKEAMGCEHIHSCDLQGNWQFINKLIYSILNTISLADMRGDLQQADFQPIHFHSISDQLQQKIQSTVNVLKGGRHE